MLQIIDATIADIPAIIDIAHKTWWPTYENLLSKEQLSFMLEKIYDKNTLTKVMSDGTQTFLLGKENNVIVGFAAYGRREEEPEIIKLHKLYLLPEMHGRGYGKILLDEVKKRTVAGGQKILDLNVKRDNPAKTFYERCGFKVLREEDIPFGPYLLQDYIMRIDL